MSSDNMLKFDNDKNTCINGKIYDNDYIMKVDDILAAYLSLKVSYDLLNEDERDPAIVSKIVYRGFLPLSEEAFFNEIADHVIKIRKYSFINDIKTNKHMLTIYEKMLKNYINIVGDYKSGYKRPPERLSIDEITAIVSD
jgi:hypothetical protein